MCTRHYGITSQKTTIFVVTDAKVPELVIFSQVRYKACQELRLVLCAVVLQLRKNLSDIYQQSQLRVFYWCYYFSLYHNMFRALRAILKWIQYITYVFKHLRKSYRFSTHRFINWSLIL
jgi:hypothetical protein